MTIGAWCNGSMSVSKTVGTCSSRVAPAKYKRRNVMNIVNAGSRFQVYGEDVKTFKELPVSLTISNLINS